ncbi:MAG: hypothetical protein K1X89_12440 [Myxococcaceae bacterium]|nr:hypothetical protein [Myxococcaceae bacterium]
MRHLAAACLSLAACSEHARPGHLAEIATPELRAVDVNSSPGRPPRWRLLLSNVDAKGRCLALGADLEVALGGVPQQVFGRGVLERPGKALVGDLSCRPLEAELLPAAGATERITVKDGTGSLEAEFPAFLLPVHFEGAPAAARPGQRVTLQASRDFLGRLEVSFIRPAALGDRGEVVQLSARTQGRTLEVDLPTTLQPQQGELFVQERGAVTATRCTAASCTATVEHTVDVPLVIEAKR